MIKYEKDLKKLESLSIQISDLISKNDYKKILELDLRRKKIINEISHSSYSFSKNKISKIINLNQEAIRDLETGMVNLTTNHNKFKNRISFYSLYK